MADMLSHDELALLIKTAYPDLRHGRDFWCSHPVALNSSEQTGPAIIAAWLTEDVPEPTNEDIADWEQAHAAVLEAVRNPPQPSPEDKRKTMAPLSRRQFRLGLLHVGISTGQIEDAIAVIPDATERAIAEIEWQDANEYQRLHPLVVTLSGQLGLSAQQVDELWEQAAKL